MNSDARLGRFHSPGISVGLIGVLVAVTAVIVGQGDPYNVNLWQTILMAMTFAVTWNYIGGLANQHSFAHPALFGVGAYAGGLILIHHPGVPLAVCLAAGAAAATGLALIMTPAFRARGPYFAILTIAAAGGIRVTGNAFFPGGTSGRLIPFDALPSDGVALGVACGITIAAILVHIVIDQSSAGSALRMLAEDEDAARAIGVPTLRLKIMAFVLGGPFLGAFGALFAATSTFIDPNTVFSLNLAVIAVLSTLLGGTGLLWGAAGGAVIWQLLSTKLRGAIEEPGFVLMLNGAILIIVIILMPRGVIGTVLHRLSRRRKQAPTVPWLRSSR
ncbi:MAG: branched-chain amino acid transport system permease protein [Kribbellaceae bacterium]|jgi:branched-chain amino acid transport system permease protein|nr:branched-chain amino acid transport system permease protein [Kribbellaceae bacterium]